MLEINSEFRKGILFVRLNGELSKKTIQILQNEVTDIILKGGIQNVVFNMKLLNDIDMKGMNSLLHHYEICKNRKGNCYICDITNRDVYMKLKKNRILNYLHEINSELTLLQLLTV